MSSSFYKYGYPHLCEKCKEINGTKILLNVEPYFQKGNNFKLMLIGQDPTIRRKKSRVKNVLMLDEPNGRIATWLKSIFGKNKLNAITLYATNCVKCTLEIQPSSSDNSFKFLNKYFRECKNYLLSEIANYKPSCVITLGESAHRMFRNILDDPNVVPEKINQAFIGKFYKVKINNFNFDYSPCLHMQTYRVAETYGKNIIYFKNGLNEYFKNNF